jgi:hypothetical protein
MEGAMRRVFATGLALAALAVAGSAFADKPVEPTDGAHQGGAAPAKAAKPAAPVKPVAAPLAPAASKRVLAQQDAMKALKLADGDWRGPSKVLRKEGWVDMVETQRVETLLDGTIRTIESRGYEKGGRLNFTAFAVISYDPSAKSYSLRSYSNGRVSDHPLEVSASGFSWESQSSPKMTVRYEAVLKSGVWTQSATRIPAEGEPEKYVEFTVKRVGKSPATEAFWAR